MAPLSASQSQRLEVAACSWISTLKPRRSQVGPAIWSVTPNVALAGKGRRGMKGVNCERWGGGKSAGSDMGVPWELNADETPCFYFWILWYTVTLNFVFFLPLWIIRWHVYRLQKKAMSLACIEKDQTCSLAENAEARRNIQRKKTGNS